MIVVDSHCDTPSQIYRLRDIGAEDAHAHVDFPKLKRGGVDAVCFAAYVPATMEGVAATGYAEKLLNCSVAAVQANSSVAALARSAEDIAVNKAAGKVSVLLAIENGSAIGDNAALLEHFRESGVVYMTLTHSADNLIADSCSGKGLWGGLSPFGREVVARMNSLGMLIDLSHSSDRTFYDVLECSSKPVVATHSCCRALANHRRNMTDEMIKALAASGGVIQINFYPSFLDDDFSAAFSRYYDSVESIEDEFIAEPGNPEKRARWYDCLDKLKALPRPSYKRIVDHIDHVVSMVGPDHVGLGSDFDGIYVTPDGLEDCSRFPLLLDELRVRGYSDVDIEKIAGGNFLRIL